MDAKTKGKARHCKRTYKQFNFRIRRESALFDVLSDFIKNGDTSLNFLITRALCAYLSCEIPHRQYSTYTRKRIL